MEAQIAASRIGAERLAALIERYGYRASPPPAKR